MNGKDTTIHEVSKMQEDGNIPYLPEDCISHIISLTSPRDACKLAFVSQAFKSAADSDLVWEKFLPVDYKDIISSSVSSICLTDFSSKKKLYFRMCDPVPFHEGNKILTLERKTGKKCVTIGVRELRIAGSDVPRYWEWTSHPESRFPEVAKLVGIPYLQIYGKVEETWMLTPKTNYVAYLIIKRADHTQHHQIQDAWVNVVVGGGTDFKRRTLYLEHSLTPRYHRCGPEVEDGWMEIEMGQFYNDQEKHVEVYTCLPKNYDLKPGVIVEGIELRPRASSTRQIHLIQG